MIRDAKYSSFVDLNWAQKKHFRGLNEALKYYLSHLNWAQNYHVCSFKAYHHI